MFEKKNVRLCSAKEMNKRFAVVEVKGIYFVGGFSCVSKNNAEINLDFGYSVKDTPHAFEIVPVENLGLAAIGKSAEDKVFPAMFLNPMEFVSIMLDMKKAVIEGRMVEMESFKLDLIMNVGVN